VISTPESRGSGGKLTDQTANARVVGGGGGVRGGGGRGEHGATPGGRGASTQGHATTRAGKRGGTGPPRAARQSGGHACGGERGVQEPIIECEPVPPMKPR